MFLNLLVVEDEEAIREGVREFLREQGLQCLKLRWCRGA